MIPLLILIIVLFVLAILGMIWAFYKIWVQNYRDKASLLNERVQTGYEISSSSNVETQRASSSSKLEQFLKNSSVTFFLEKRMAHSGMRISSNQFISICIFLFIGVLCLNLYSQVTFWPALIIALLIAAIPYAWIALKYERRQLLLERQLPDILDFIARSMQAGHDFNSALRIAAQESPMPISEEFQLVFDEINFGGTIHHSMEGLSHRIECPDVRYFSIAVLINREIGGDISTLLKNVASLIRDRLTFKDTIYAMTAEGRVSAMILGAMPFLIGILIFYVSPGFIDVLWTDPMGKKMSIYGLLLMIFGGIWMYRLVQIKV